MDRIRLQSGHCPSPYHLLLPLFEGHEGRVVFIILAGEARRLRVRLALPLQEFNGLRELPGTGGFPPSGKRSGGGGAREDRGKDPCQVLSYLPAASALHVFNTRSVPLHVITRRSQWEGEEGSRAGKCVAKGSCRLATVAPPTRCRAG